jgi:hypothetical protein
VRVSKRTWLGFWSDQCARAGIGIRVSIYVQAVFVLLCASAVSMTVARGDGALNRGRMFLQLANSSMGLLLTGIALLISSFIQARYYGLSVYHSIIVVEISLVNMWTALPAYSFVLSDTARTLRRWITLNRRHKCSKVCLPPVLCPTML